MLPVLTTVNLLLPTPSALVLEHPRHSASSDWSLTLLMLSTYSAIEIPLHGPSPCSHCHDQCRPQTGGVSGVTTRSSGTNHQVIRLYVHLWSCIPICITNFLCCLKYRIVPCAPQLLIGFDLGNPLPELPRHKILYSHRFSSLAL